MADTSVLSAYKISRFSGKLIIISAYGLSYAFAAFGAVSLIIGINMIAAKPLRCDTE